jgi:Holliday junction resolvasome RuvABC endonuclease subunit
VKLLRRTTDDLVVGIDQSANGSAAAVLENGRLAHVLFFADTKKASIEFSRSTMVGNFTAEAVEPVRLKTADDEVGKTRRLREIRDQLSTLLRTTNPTHVAFEGYSMTRAPVASRVLGEVGGIVRVLLADLRIPFRVYPVEAVKSFATGNGAAEKAEMVLACRDRWDKPNFLRFGKTEGAAGNLADAYVIAQLLRLELRVRAGLVELESLDPTSRAVLRRTTPKRQPIPILETPFAEVPR